MIKRMLASCIVAVVLLAAAQVFAAGSASSCTDPRRIYRRGKMYVLRSRCTFTADDTDGSIIPNATIKKINGVVFQAVVDPGATGPTNGAWDVALNDDMSCDVFGGAMTDMSSTVSGHFKPLVQGLSSSDRYVRGDGTVVWTGNAVVDATGTIDFYILR